jgi:3-deoxy-D-manno-octulosonate 8-phosphate phosphatase (KDO 8-P phosphatase)
MTALAARLARLELVCFDVDGVFTDGRLWFGPQGEALKQFHVRDGHGVKELIASGVAIAVVSGRSSPVVSQRMAELGVAHVYQGCAEKLPFVTALLAQLGLPPEAAAFVGDDLPDLPPMRALGAAIAPADAHPAVRAAAHWVTTAGGGMGAVREVCDAILEAQAQTGPRAR